jgi:2-(1,2-epoxy-1,2-dihydrophenyl)acetyl-CoA isomerase
VSTLRTSVEDGVLLVELDRPERLNAMNRELLLELGSVFEGCREGAVLLSGRGRAFCSGADLREITFEPAQLRSLMGTVRRLVLAMEASPAAIVAHVHGAAVGGGFCLAALCDLVFADSSAVFAVNQATRGLVPDMGVLWLLPRQIGELNARRLLLLGERFDAAEALRLGIVSRLCDREQALAAARELAANRECVALTKQGLRRGRRSGLAELLDFEVDAEVRAFATERVQRSIQDFVHG